MTQRADHQTRTRTFFFCGGLALLAACGNSHKAPQKDFFVAPPTDPAFHATSAPIPFDLEACRARIGDIACLVKPQDANQPSAPRECDTTTDISGGVAALQAIYDAYPNSLKNIFCGLGKIYLEQDFAGTAYAGSDTDGKTAVVGIRASLLLQKPVPPMSDWITWKEQLSFGGNPNDYSTRTDLVQVQAGMNLAAPASDFLYYVIAHEFGHLLDFANGVNNFDCKHPTDDGLCLPAPGSWSALSWQAQVQHPADDPTDPWGLKPWVPNDSGTFEHRLDLCFYSCPAGHGDASIMKPLYDSLQKSSFLTTYSATNAFDDFAEAVAFWVGTHNVNLEYSVHLPSGEVYDLSQKFMNELQYQAKKAWLDAFFDKVNAPQAASK